MVKNGTLSFKDQETLENTVLKNLNLTHEELNQWEEELGFQSIRSIYEKVFDEYEQIKTIEEFLEFKEKYKDIFAFNETDPEDYGYYYPTTQAYLASVLNVHGEVIVDGKLQNFKDLLSYPSSTLKSGTIPNYNVTEYYKKTSNRKFRCTIQQIYNRDDYQARFSAQKKVAFGWTNYKADYFWKFIKVKHNGASIGQNGPYVGTTYAVYDQKEATPTIIFKTLPGEIIMETWNSGVGEGNKGTLKWTHNY